MDRFELLRRACKGPVVDDWRGVVMRMFVGFPVLLLIDESDGRQILVNLGSFELVRDELLLDFGAFPSRLKLDSFLRPTRNVCIPFPPELHSIYLDSIFRTDPPMSTIGRLVLPIGPKSFVDFATASRSIVALQLRGTPEDICKDPSFIDPELIFPLHISPCTSLISTLPMSLIPIPSFACGFVNGMTHLTYKLRPVYADVSMPKDDHSGCRFCASKSFDANGLFPKIYVSLTKVAEVMRTWNDRKRAAFDLVLAALRHGCIFPQHYSKSNSNQFSPIPTEVQFSRMLRILQSYSNSFSASVQYYNMRSSMCVVKERDGAALDALELISKMYKQVLEFSKWAQNHNETTARLRASTCYSTARLLGWGVGLSKEKLTKVILANDFLPLSLKRDRDWIGCPLCESTECTSPVAGTKRVCDDCDIEYCCKCDRIVQIENQDNCCTCTLDKTRCISLLKRAEKAGVPFIEITD